VRRGNRYRYYISSALLHDRKSQGLTAPQPPWAAYGHAAAQASDLFEQLGRNSEKLIAVAGQLRAKRTNDVIDMLHNVIFGAPGQPLSLLHQQRLAA
jgi:hypothetical protein